MKTTGHKRLLFIFINILLGLGLYPFIAIAQQPKIEKVETEIVELKITVGNQPIEDNNQNFDKQITLQRIIEFEGKKKAPNETLPAKVFELPNNSSVSSVKGTLTTETEGGALIVVKRSEKEKLFFINLTGFEATRIDPLVGEDQTGTLKITINARIKIKLTFSVVADSTGTAGTFALAEDGLTGSLTQTNNTGADITLSDDITWRGVVKVQNVTLEPKNKAGKVVPVSTAGKVLKKDEQNTKPIDTTSSPRTDSRRVGFQVTNGSNEATLDAELTGTLTIKLGQTGSVLNLPKSAEVALAIEFPSPTLIELSSFTIAAGDGQVILEWTTGAEIDNEGFNILRSQVPDGPSIKINDALIPAKGVSPGGANYEFLDTAVENGKTYFYKLEDVDTGGKKTERGPLEIAVIEGNTASLDPSAETSTGAVTSDTSGEASSWFGCGFIKPTGSMRPPSSGEMAGTLFLLSLPFLWVLLRRLWRLRRNIKTAAGALPSEAG